MPESSTRRLLIGRAHEMSILDSMMLAATNGRPGTAVVRGEDGIGKTTLLRKIAHQAEATVLWAVSHEHETDRDHGLSAQLLAGSAATTDGALRGLGLRGGQPVDPFTVGAALLDHLGDLAVETPVVVLVDDAHIADLASLHALTFAARRLAVDAVGLVVAARAESPHDDRLPSGLLQLAATTGGVLDLEGLSPTEVTELARTVSARPVPAEAGRRIHEHTGGNPMRTLWLLGESSAASLGAGDRLPEASSTATFVASRLALCSPAAQRLAHALAVLNVRSPLDQVAAVAGVEVSPDAVAELTGRGFVIDDGGTTGPALTFAHPSIQAGIYADMNPESLRAGHLAAASVVGGEQGLRHRLAAASGPDDSLAAEAGQAAKHARAQGALSAASQLLFEAARLTDDRDESDTAFLQAVELLLDAGEPASRWYEDVVDLAPSARRSYVLGRLALALGRVDEGRSLIEQSWQQLEAAKGRAPDANLVGAVADTLARIAVDQRSPGEAERWARRALAASEDVPVAGTLAYALLFNGRANDVGSELAPYLSAYSEVVGFDDGETSAMADALLGRAVSRLVTNDLDGAAADLAEAGRAVEEGTQGQVVGHLRTYLAELYFRQGRWPMALDVAELAASLAEDADAPWLAVGPRSIAASVAANCGDQRFAAAHAERAAAGARASNMQMPWLWASLAELHMAEASGDHNGVVAVGDRLTTDGWMALPASLLHWQTSYVEGLVAVGRLNDALAVAATLEGVDTNENSQINTALATVVARAAAAIATAQGDDAAARTALEAALARDAVLARPFPRARLELVAGMHWRRIGSRRRAARLFERAASRFQRLGARPWIARCEAELVACGVRPAGRTGASSVVLTPRERAVANLVRAGRTDREVAGELVISVKTVEHHLAGVCAKFDVGSRTELAALLATGGP